MPRPISHGQRIITLFARLLFARRPLSLTELAETLECSKATVSRLLKDIQEAHSVVVERIPDGKEALFRISTPNPIPAAAGLSLLEMDLLWMCCAFTQQLLGKDLFKAVTNALDNTRPLVRGERQPPVKGFGSIRPGTINYSAHRNTITTLIEAIDERRVCRITYKGMWSKEAKTFHIKPLTIFAHKDALYVHALKAMEPGTKYVRPEFDPLLAVHRIRKVEKADQKTPFDVPQEYDFQKSFNRTFGIIKQEEPFEVEAEFTDWAAVHVAERHWSPDQSMELHDDTLTIRFTASSEPEVKAWILSFGDAGRLRKPDNLVREVAEVIASMKTLYE
ncbi:MAG: WYL domain-containing protein [Pseudomonadota bacterium]